METCAVASRISKHSQVNSSGRLFRNPRISRFLHAQHLFWSPCMSRFLQVQPRWDKLRQDKQPQVGQVAAGQVRSGLIRCIRDSWQGLYKYTGRYTKWKLVLLLLEYRSTVEWILPGTYSGTHACQDSYMHSTYSGAPVCLDSYRYSRDETSQDKTRQATTSRAGGSRSGQVRSGQVRSGQVSARCIRDSWQGLYKYTGRYTKWKLVLLHLEYIGIGHG
jgi:hypothetical protein